MNEKENNDLSHLEIISVDEKGKETDVSENVELRIWPGKKSKFVEKPDFLLKITGKLEIDFNDKNKTIKDFEIEAKDLNVLIKKLLNEITEVSLSKLQEALQFIIEKRSEDVN